MTVADDRLVEIIVKDVLQKNLNAAEAIEKTMKILGITVEDLKKGLVEIEPDTEPDTKQDNSHTI